MGYLKFIRLINHKSFYQCQLPYLMYNICFFYKSINLKVFIIMEFWSLIKHIHALCNRPLTCFFNALLDWFLTCSTRFIHKTILKVTRYFFKLLGILSDFHPHKLNPPKNSCVFHLHAALLFSGVNFGVDLHCWCLRGKISSFQFIYASNIKHSYHPENSVRTKFFCLEPL